MNCYKKTRKVRVLVVVVAVAVVVVVVVVVVAVVVVVVAQHTAHNLSGPETLGIPRPRGPAGCQTICLKRFGDR